MKSRTLHVLFLAGLALLVLPGDEAYGQARGFVSGEVVDEDGNPIEGVLIRIESMDIARKYRVKSDKKGRYLHAGVHIQSTYRVIAEKEGYQTDYIQGIKPGFTREEERGVHNFTLRKGSAAAKLAFEMTEAERQAMEKKRAEQEQLAKDMEAVRESFNQGVNLYNAGQYEGASKAFLEVLEKDATQPSVWANLGNCYSKIDQNEKALEAYDKALELDSENATYYQNKGSILAAMGRVDEARELYEKAASMSATLDPSEAAVSFYNMGVTYINAGKNEDAEDSLRKALELGPTHADAHYQLGLTLIGLNDMEGAVQHLKKYIELSPNSEDAAVAQALIEQLSG
jgi:tetratricopeptide (TPR) repeat protein